MRIKLSLTWKMRTLAFSLLINSGCQESEYLRDTVEETRYQDFSPVIATVGHIKITQDEMDRRLSELSPLSRARYQNLDRRKELIDSLIRFELLSKEALRLGHGEHPEVKLAYKQAMIRELLKHEVRSLVKIGDITNDEIEAYYKEHIDDYQRPTLVRVSHILLKTEAEAKAKLKELQLHLKAEPKKARMTFGDFATTYSIDQESRARRGDLQYFDQNGELVGDRLFPQSSLPKVVATEAFKLTKIGELSQQVIRSEKGWHILQRTGGKRAFKRSLKEVKTEIRNLLFRVRKSKALEDYVAQLKTKTQVKINEKALEKIKIEAERKVRGPKHDIKLPLDLAKPLSP